MLRTPPFSGKPFILKEFFFVKYGSRTVYRHSDDIGAVSGGRETAVSAGVNDMLELGKGY